VRVAKTPTLVAQSQSAYSFFVKNLDEAGQSRLLVGVFECCADSHDCGVVVVVGGCLEYYICGCGLSSGMDVVYQLRCGGA
jgi:hypothetical protein